LAAILSAVIRELCALVPNAWNAAFFQLLVGQATHINIFHSPTDWAGEVV
jgi:hypothetical protein